jgi:N-sulfoglucosamine sulfohydrolase
MTISTSPLPLALARSLLLLLIGYASAHSAPPNILFAIADDWGPHASAYGTQWIRTPHFDRVATSGVLFRNAFTPNAKCAPSRACILTGRNPWQLKAAANHICFFPPEFQAWPETLVAKGWNVGFTAKGWGPGVALDHSGSPRNMTGKPWNEAKTKAPTNGISPIDYATNFDRFLDATPKDKPWCFWYGGLEPHRGYEYGSGIAKGGKKLEDLPRVPAFWPDNDIIRNDILDYAFEAEHFDAHLGKMLDSLERRGLLDNTLVIVTSDHGMPFPRSKGNANPTANHVPLAVMWKLGRFHSGRTVDDFVSFIDLAPTLLDFAGIPVDQSGMASITGKTLRPLLESDLSGQIDPNRDHVLIGRERNDIGRPNDAGYPVRGIITHSHCYLENIEPTRWPAGNPETGYLDTDASPTKTHILQTHRSNPSDPFWHLCFGKRSFKELYDRNQDPDCVKNLAKNDDTSSMLTTLANRLHSQLKAQGDPREEGRGAEFDAFPHSNRSHAGFYERFLGGERIKAGWVDESDFEPFPAKP